MAWLAKWSVAECIYAIGDAVELLEKEGISQLSEARIREEIQVASHEGKQSRSECVRCRRRKTGEG